MEELQAELAPEFGAGRVFRPYRDVRFSPDKTPYKTNVAATVGEMGYVMLSAEGLTAGAGRAHLAADELDRYRKAVDDARTGPALEEAVAAVRKAGHEWEPYEALKTAPRGYPKDHPRIRFLRHKGLYCSKGWPPEPWLHTKAAKKRIVDAWRGSQPLCDWLDRHVGPSTLVEQS